VPLYYDPKMPAFPGEKISGRDLRINVDIGGDQKIKDLRPDEQLFASMGSAVTDTVKTGIEVGSKIPGVKEAAELIGNSPVGAALGATMDLLNLPSAIIGTGAAFVRKAITAKEDLPADIQRMMSAGASEWDIVQYMVSSQRAWSNSQEANLVFSLLTDPLTYLTMGVGKVGMLKPIAGVAGGTLGAVAAGAAAGSMGLGAIGAVGGGLVAGVKASGIASRFAVKAMEKSGAIQRVAERANLAKSAGKIGDVAAEAKAAEEIAALGGQLTSAERAAIYLNTPRGLDLANRLSIGRGATKEIAEAGRILKNTSDPEVIRAATKRIDNARDAMAEANAIDDGFMYGIYNAYKGMSGAVSGQAKSMFGAAFTVPANMMIQRTMGGLRVNERIAEYTGIFPSEIASSFSELAGRGMANFGIIGMQSVVSGSNAYRAKNVAERIAKTFFDAKDDLGRSAGSGASVKFTPDEIIEKMRENVMAQAAARGGDTGLVGMFDTGNVGELRKRIEYLTTLDSKAAALTPGRGTLPQIKALASYIESELNIGDIQQIRNSGGSYEKTLAKRIHESGMEEFAKAGADQINTRMQQLVFDVSNKAKARTMFMAHAESATIGLGQKWESVAAKWEASFERRFGKFYDAAGNPRARKRFQTDEDVLTEAAEEMLFMESVGYSGATEASGLYNSLVARVTSKDPTLIAELGKEAVEELSAVFSQTGKISLVGKNHLFYDKVVGLTRTYQLINTLSDELESANKTVVPDAANALEDGLPSAVATRAGNERTVSVLRTQVKTLRKAAASEGEEYGKILTKFDQSLAGAKNLDDARRIWSEIANGSLDDVRAFGDIKSHKDIFEFLRDVERQGLAVHKLPDSKLALVAKALRTIGYDESFIAGLRSGAYRVVEAPASNKIYKPSLIDNPAMTPDQQRIFASKVVPFVDMTDQGVIAAGKRMLPRAEYKANFMQEFGTKMFSPIPQKYVTASIKRRMGSYLARGGLSQTHVEAILDELVERGIAKGVSARGLTTPEHYDALKAGVERIGGPGSYKAFIDNFQANTLSKTELFNPTAAVMYAFRGDKAVVGATQYLTGGAKTWAPSIAKLTDDWYPTMKFKMNPMYYIQEYLESPTLNAARGVDANTVASMTRDGKISTVSGAQLRNLGDVGAETQNYLDNVNFLAVFRNDAIAQASTGRYDDVVAATGLWENIRRGRSLGKLAQSKEAARDALALDLTAKTFSDTLRDKDFGTWAALSKHYGTTDARSIFTNYVNYRLRLGDEKRVWSDIEASRPAGIGFNRIPDPDGSVRFLAKQELITGGRYSPEDAALAGKTGGLTEAELLDVYVKNPHLYRSELDKHLISMEDAGYDMTVLNPAGQKLRNAINRLENETRSGMGVDAETLSMITSARSELADAFAKLDDQSIELVHKQSAMRTLASASGMINPDSLDELSDLVIQTMLVGKGFSVGAQNVIDAVNRSVLKARKAGLDPRKDGRLFSEAVSTAMMGEISANKRLVDVFGESAMEIVSMRSAEETVYNAFQYAYTKALEQANKTTYYASERSFFERTVNHPMLGFYPYSYMFKKILPEMTQFLFKGAFGAKAPLAGYSAYMNVRDYIEAQIEQDPSFRRAIEDKQDFMYMTTMLFPGVPWDVSVVPPAWARNVYKRMRTDKDIDVVDDIVINDFFRSFWNIGPMVSIPIVSDAFGNAFEDDGPKPVAPTLSQFPSALD